MISDSFKIFKKVEGKGTFNFLTQKPVPISKIDFIE